MCRAIATVKIVNEYGLHARPATALSQTAAAFQSSVTVSRTHPHASADGASLMSLLALAVTFETEITIEARGPDADDAVAALVSLIESKFGEEAQAGEQQ
ncbi:MAG: HPr family phosphocarrier protein [Planctomycetota bacterium]|jgi:phosphocarrier protein